MEKVNPLVSYNSKVQAIIDDECEPSDIVDKDLQYEYLKIMQTSSSESKEFALQLMKVADKCSSNDIDIQTVCYEYFSDPFMSIIVALALDGWWNDTIGACCDALGFDINGIWAEQIEAYEMLISR